VRPGGVVTGAALARERAGRTGRGVWLDRRLIKRGFRAGQPLTTLRLIVARRSLAAPGAWLAARADLGGARASSWWRYIPRRAGYRLFGPDGFPELAHVVAASQAVFERHRDEVAEQDAYNKPYFFNVLDADDLRGHPALAAFALSAPVVAAVTGYLRQVPRLHSMGVFYSAVNDTIDGSQMYHVDGDALTQVKCFVNAWDVGPGGGAFTFVPKPQTGRAWRSAGLLKTLADAEVVRAVPEAAQVALTGPAGTGAFVDTSRCLHQGSRSRTQPRLVFQFQYVPRPDTLLPRPAGQIVRGGHLLIGPALLAGLPIENADADRYLA
jgi:hypothetical protein